MTPANIKKRIRLGKAGFQPKAYIRNMKHLSVLLSLACLYANGLNAQVYGCTDSLANNYNPAATLNNGSCTYDNTSVTMKPVCAKLNDSIMETSGLIHFNGNFWTLNDSNNPPVLYQFDSLSGNISHQTYIKNEVNNDWEELTQDSLFIYIGEFGNNRGSRKDLKILKIRKKDMNLAVFYDTVTAESIFFDMQDQLNFNNTGQNHDYDMEAFCVIGDSLHLFSKNWVDNKSRHYICPKTAGTYSLMPAETLDVNGQVTGACYRNGVLVLTGYNKGGQGSFFYLLWDSKDNRFMQGNRRRIDCGTFIQPGQNEAVCFAGRSLYMSSEKQFSNAALYRVYTGLWTGPAYSTRIRTLPKSMQNIKIFAAHGQLHIEHNGSLQQKVVEIYDYSGRKIHSITLRQNHESIDINNWAQGIYILRTSAYVLAELEL